MTSTYCAHPLHEPMIEDKRCRCYRCPKCGQELISFLQIMIGRNSIDEYFDRLLYSFHTVAATGRMS